MESSSSGPDGRRFDFQTCLGRGGFGEVYLADMTSPGGLRTTVAVKLLLAGLDPRSQAVQRLRDEAKLLAALRHVNILTVYDLVLLDDRVGLIAEYVEGADLKACMYGEHTLPARALVEALERVADALDAAYNTPRADGQPMRLVHRDIKPANIRLSTRGAVKVLDFGIAKASLDDREAKTQTDTIMGTVAYMAPERFQADVPDVGPEGDVFALGCVLYEGLAQTPLFEDRSLHQVMGLAYAPDKHRAWVAERVDALQMPDALRHMLRRLLDYDPAQRPTAAAFVEWCEENLAALPGPPLRRWCRQHTWPPPEDADGELVGRSLTEGTRPSWSIVEPDAAIAPRGALAPAPDGDGRAASAPPPPPPVPSDLRNTGAVSPETRWVDDRSGTPVAPRAASAPGSAPAPSSTPAPPPSPELAEDPPRKRRGALLPILAVVGVLGVLLLGGVGVIGAVAAGGWAWFSVDPAPGAAVEASAPGDPTPVAADGEEGEDATDTAAADATNNDAAPDDGMASADADARPGPGSEAGDAETTEAMLAAAPADCPLDDLEASVRNGGLSPSERACATASMMDEARSQTEREAYGKVVVEHGRMRCKAGAGCAEFETSTTYFLQEITQSDPTICLIWSEHLFGEGITSEAQAEQVIKWAKRAFERRTVWTGRDFVVRVQRVHELQAKAAGAAFVLTESTRWQNRGRDRAVEWANYQLQLGRDASEAIRLCIDVAGSEKVCRSRIFDPSKEITVSLLSVPLGGSVRIDGKQAGQTPLNVALPEGEHQVQIDVDDITGVRDITVGMARPTRYVFKAGTDEWVETQ